MLKIIELPIPSDKVISEIMKQFTPEENYLMLKIGSECLNECKESIAKLSQQELSQKIREETQNELMKLEQQIVLEREISKRCEEKLASVYEKEKQRLEAEMGLY
jgi:hypothetical protein